MNNMGEGLSGSGDQHIQQNRTAIYNTLDELQAYIDTLALDRNKETIIKALVVQICTKCEDLLVDKDKGPLWAKQYVLIQYNAIQEDNRYPIVVCTEIANRLRRLYDQIVYE